VVCAPRLSLIHPVAREVRRGEDMMCVFYIVRVISPSYF
jgi:hypothetical protein